MAADLTDTITATDIRNAAREAFPGVSLIVLEAAPHTWTGFRRTREFARNIRDKD